MPAYYYSVSLLYISVLEANLTYIAFHISTVFCKPAVSYCTLASIFLYYHLSITLNTASKGNYHVSINTILRFLYLYHVLTYCIALLMFSTNHVCFLILGRPYEVMDDPMRSSMDYEVIERPMRSWGYPISFILFPDVISYDGQGRTARQTTMRSLLA